MYRKSAYFLFVAVLGLLVIGIVMLFSTSAFAKDSHGDPYFFLKHQSVWLGVGLAICVAAALIDYHFWQRTWWLWLGVAAVTLVFCFIPHRSEQHTSELQSLRQLVCRLLLATRK